VNTNTLRHRHFVALPAFLLLVSMSFADSDGDVSRVISSVTSSFSSTEDSTFPAGTYGEVIEGDLLVDNGLVLTSGIVRLGSQSQMTLSIDSLTLTVFDGGLYAAKTNDSVTIAAITSPVFVTHGDQRVIIPVGMQWNFSGDSIDPLTAGFKDWMHARKLSPLPSHFLEEQIIALHLAEQRAVEDVPALRSYLPVDALSVDTLLLPVSLASEQDERADHVLGVVRKAIEDNNTVYLAELSQNEEVSLAIKSLRGRRMLGVLLSQRDLSTAMRMEVLLRIADTESLWSVTSFHPEYRDVAWSLIGPDVSIESQLARAFLFPFSLFSAEEVSDFVLDRYRMTILGMVQSVGDSSLFVDNILDAHLTLIDRLETKGYPRRAAHMSDTLVALIDSMESQTEAMTNALEYLSLSSAIDLTPLPEKRVLEVEVKKTPEPEPEPVASEVVYGPLEVEAMAQVLLQDSGALFTTQTGIAAYADNKARVSGIYFSAPTEDRKVAFTLDVYTKIVSEIEINGQSDFPYEPSFAGFVEWISK
jgi:hypothetical protein